MQVIPSYSSKVASVLGADAITLYPFVFFAMSKDEAVSRRVIHHELVHVRQVRALGWAWFYMSYLWLFLKAFVRVWSYDRAYMANAYEIEAYANEKTIVPTVKELQEFGVANKVTAIRYE